VEGGGKSNVDQLRTSLLASRLPQMVPRYEQLPHDGLGEGVKKGLLHLQVLGVHPEFRQKGIGKVLVRHMLKQVGVARTTITLVSSVIINEVWLRATLLEPHHALRHARK
jgi:ribosomal protein S18 acetylase RimI-like enzyme